MAMKIRRCLSGEAAAAGNSVNVSMDFICRNVPEATFKVWVNSPVGEIRSVILRRGKHDGNGPALFATFTRNADGTYKKPSKGTCDVNDDGSLTVTLKRKEDVSKTYTYTAKAFDQWGSSTATAKVTYNPTGTTGGGTTGGGGSGSGNSGDDDGDDDDEESEMPVGIMANNSDAPTPMRVEIGEYSFLLRGGDVMSAAVLLKKDTGYCITVAGAEHLPPPECQKKGPYNDEGKCVCLACTFDPSDALHLYGIGSVRLSGNDGQKFVLGPWLVEDGGALSGGYKGGYVFAGAPSNMGFKEFTATMTLIIVETVLKKYTPDPGETADPPDPNDKPDELKVATWESVFNASGEVVKKEDPFKTDKEAFCVRVFNPKYKYGAFEDANGPEKIFVKVRTQNADANYNYESEPIELKAQLDLKSRTTGVYLSKAQVLVSDDEDANPQGAFKFNNSDTQRTHKVALGGKVNVMYDPLNPNYSLGYPYRVAKVPVEKTVTLNVVILRTEQGGNGIVSKDKVQKDLLVAQERFAQVGVKLKWGKNNAEDDIDEKDPLGQVGTSGGKLREVFPVNVYNKEKDKFEFTKATEDLISMHGSSSKKIINVFYVNQMSAWALSEIPGANQVVKLSPYGYSFPPFISEKYRHNCIISKDSIEEIPSRFILAHELAHILANEDHKKGSGRDINLLKDLISNDNTYKSTKRLTKEQKTKIHKFPNPR